MPSMQKYQEETLKLGTEGRRVRRGWNQPSLDEDFSLRPLRPPVQTACRFDPFADYHLRVERKLGIIALGRVFEIKAFSRCFLDTCACIP